MDNKYIARPCCNCEVNDCCFKGHENNFEICEDYTATNGDMIKTIFPNAQIREICRGELIEFTLDSVVGISVTKDWWNAPYKKEVEE